MRSMSMLMRGAAVAALLVAGASPAAAQSRTDRAREAITEAQAKVDAANKVGASGEVPRLQAEAQASLRTAREDLARGAKDHAIANAHHASELADTALGVAERAKREASQAQQAQAAAAAEAAQRQAAAANARADAAEQAAASAAADAQAARNTPPPAPVVVAAPAPAPTTVTVERTEQASTATAPAKTVTHRVVRRTTARPAHRAATVKKTTTTVTATTGQ